MAHPVGSGLAVAFIQIVVGVLSILGLWQRAAAGMAMALSAALLFTVSWRAVPVYDTPDLIFLAAWSPLLIAGAPFGSLDGRIALEAWRRYGSSAPAALRRRILRRSGVVTAVVVGLTLLLGSMLGAAVRTGGRTDPAPAKPPTDFGSPMWPGNGPSPTPPGRSGAEDPRTDPDPLAQQERQRQAPLDQVGVRVGRPGAVGQGQHRRYRFRRKRRRGRDRAQAGQQQQFERAAGRGARRSAAGRDGLGLGLGPGRGGRLS
ncbi:hypothetical protein ACFQ0T_23000 [Kitasatospora gansuensis]